MYKIALTLILLQGVTNAAQLTWLNSTASAVTVTYAGDSMTCPANTTITMPITPSVQTFWNALGGQQIDTTTDWVRWDAGANTVTERVVSATEGPWPAFTAGFGFTFGIGILAIGAGWVRKIIGGDTPE